ncbi:MAG: S8 family peptidase [Bacteroidetes bacterium]|nr:S8 family peptidase [Bacteroidota bacterium]
MKITQLSKRITLLLASIVLLSSSYTLHAGTSIQLKSGVIQTQNDFEQKANEAPLVSEIYNGMYYRLLQFEKLPTAQQKVSMELSGIAFLGYIPSNTYYVAIPITYNLEQLKAFQARTILPIDINSKLTLRLRENDIPAYAKKGGNVDLIVQYFKNLSFATVSAELSARGCTVLSNYAGTQLITINVAENNWKNIAQLPFIKFMQVIDDVPVPDDTKGRSLHRSNVINSDYPMGRHYDGSGVSIALADDGFVGPHIDFTGRITQFSTIVGQNHGDMTSGIAVGAGNLDPTIKGMASGAHIYIYDISGYAQIVDAAQHLAQYGTVVTSTSYSQGCNVYDAFAQQGDQIMNQLKVVLPVFSAGNNNGNSCGYGAGAQWGNITGGYKQGKNCIAAANLDAFQVIDNTSSHGPAEDGRIKPDISSNGKDQMSTDENNTFQVGGGTSAACPGMAGICAQLYQAYRELTGEPNPEAALIKACLLNSAEDIGVVGPDYFYGYGRVNALAAVKTLENMNYMSDSIENGNSNSFNINVPAGTKQVRVMLLWNDVEGDPAAARALVNDLTLMVTDPTTAVFNPWVLNPAPLASTLDDPAIRSIDSLNNMEQVTIANPTPGSYTVTVEGGSVPFGPQKYYVVYQFDQDEIVVTYPNGGEGFVPTEKELLRWDAFGTSGTFNLAYSADSGATWNTITNVAGTARQYEWTIPSTLSSNALIRVTNGVVSGQNSVPFSIIGVPQNVHMDWACSDSLKISWNAVSGADTYEISQLGAFYMDSIATSATNSAVISNSNLSDTLWFSVRAVKANGKGRRAIAINKLPGLLNCSNALDAALINQSPGSGLAYECYPLANYPVTINVGNIGLPSISNFDVSYQLDGGTIVTQNIPGTVSFGNTTAVAFTPTIDITTAGNHILKSWITYPADANHANDTLISTFTTSPQFVAPITEAFQAATFPPANWLVLASNPTYKWAKSASITGAAGGTTVSAWFDNYSYNSTGSEDRLVTELVDISAMAQPEFSFDVAYAQYQTYEDELVVEISTDCGLTFTPTGYSKKGAALASAGTSNTDWKPTNANQWRKDVVILTPYLSAGNVLLRFLNINGFGNNLYIDNVNISDGPLSTKQLSFSENVSVYPNPGNGLFTYALSDFNTKDIKVEVFDAQGKLAHTAAINNFRNSYQGTIDLQTKPKGIYMLKISSGDKTYFQKLMFQ